MSWSWTSVTLLPPARAPLVCYRSGLLSGFRVHAHRQKARPRAGLFYSSRHGQKRHSKAQRQRGVRMREENPPDIVAVLGFRATAHGVILAARLPVPRFRRFVRGAAPVVPGGGRRCMPVVTIGRRAARRAPSRAAALKEVRARY